MGRRRSDKLGRAAVWWQVREHTGRRVPPVRSARRLGACSLFEGPCGGDQFSRGRRMYRHQFQARRALGNKLSPRIDRLTKCQPSRSNAKESM